MKEHSEAGSALPLVAGILVTLMALSALAIDLGWIYLSAARVQRAADASALAGVVHLPGFPTRVDADTAAAATANGYQPGAGSTLTWTELADNKLQVNLTTTVPSFFIKVVGIDSFTIARTATAQYVKPVPMGSPNNTFGLGTDPSQLFWAAISGPRTNKFNGDAFATRWWSDSGWNPPENNNSEYRPAGYYYAIEVPSGASSPRVRIYDAGFYDRGSFNFQTGDRFQDSGGGADTNYQVYNQDSTPSDPTDNPPLSGCGWSINSGASASTYRNRWRTLCNLPSTPGIYVLRVWTTGNGGGTNQYAIRATSSSGGNPRVYGINDISIFTNQSGISTLNIAEVDEVHAGKTLELRFYDPGEDDNNAYMSVRRPDGTTATCDWIAEDEGGTVQRSDSGTCRIQTSDGNSFFQGMWVTALVEIPDTYSCGSACWWTMRIENSQPHDRTTWAARVIGNPVRLVPNP